MNKLMIAAAAALCASVGMSDGVSSQNIVGYSTVNIPVGYSMFTPVFENVDSAKNFTLGQITVCNSSGVELDDNESGAGKCRGYIQVMKLKDSKCEVSGATPYTTAGYSKRATSPEKWGWKTATNMVINAGEGIIVNNENGVTRKFLVSGGVILKPVVDIPVGYSIFGNPTPVDITLGDITVCNTSGVELDDNESGAGKCRGYIQVMKLKDGKCEVTGAIPYTTAGYSKRATSPEKWGWKTATNTVVAAGEALIVNNENGVTRKFKLKDTIPSAE